MFVRYGACLSAEADYIRRRGHFGYKGGGEFFTAAEAVAEAPKGKGTVALFATVHGKVGRSPRPIFLGHFRRATKFDDAKLYLAALIRLAERGQRTTPADRPRIKVQGQAPRLLAYLPT